MNLSIKQSIFPNCWKTGIVTPVFKAGDPLNVANYRPISILSAVSKITEKVLTEQIFRHAQ